MEPGNNMRNLKEMSVYLKRSLKFYEMKNETITPVIFTIVLFISFVGVFIPRREGMLSAVDIIYNAVSIIVVYLASSVYLISFIKELKGEDFTFAGSIRLVAGKSFRIIAATILYLAAVISGTLLLVVPGIVVYISFLFYNCFLTDAKTGIIEALKESKNMVKGRKLEIFGLIAMINIILLPLMMITVLTFSGSQIVLSFVLTFVGAVTNIIQQRLTALIYVDLQYGLH